MKSLHTDAQWIEIFNTGKTNREITAEYGYQKWTLVSARKSVVDLIEIPFVDKAPGTHGKSNIACFHEDLRNMLSWNWNIPSMVRFLFTAYNVTVSDTSVKKYCKARFEVAS